MKKRHRVQASIAHSTAYTQAITQATAPAVQRTSFGAMPFLQPNIMEWRTSWTKSQVDRQADKQTSRQADKQTSRQADKPGGAGTITACALLAAQKRTRQISTDLNRSLPITAGQTATV
ncbi:hypothetical protein B5S31_g2117 [[Candida] boidinii]|nr:hypothetical protein B5S31_g2117 [[Candida] boidinii]